MGKGRDLKRLRAVKNYKQWVRVNADWASCVCYLAIIKVQLLSSHRDWETEA